MNAVTALVFWLCTLFGVPADTLGGADMQLTRGSTNPQELPSDPTQREIHTSRASDTDISNGF